MEFARTKADHGTLASHMSINCGGSIGVWHPDSQTVVTSNVGSLHSLNVSWSAGASNITDVKIRGAVNENADQYGSDVGI